LGFLDEEGKRIWLLLHFFGMEEKANPWCGRKDYSLECKESLLIVKELMYILYIKE
jgi:hypothetical protein